MRWYLKDALCGERVTRSTRSWSVHWDRISGKFLNFASELVVRLIFDSLRDWYVGWAPPMLYAVRGLRVFKTFAEYTDLWLVSLKDLMCSESRCQEMQLYSTIKLYVHILPAKSLLLVNTGRLFVAKQIFSFVSSQLTNHLSRLRASIRLEDWLRMGEA